MMRVVMLAVILLLLNANFCSAGADAPYTIRVQGRLEGVTCSMGCCCGSVMTTYHGHWYIGMYCKWFKPLHVGDVVIVTARRERW